MNSLNEMMQQVRQPGAYLVPGGRAGFMEVFELATGTQWMSAEPATEEDFAGLNPGADYIPFGIARASMDAAMFQHSPDGEGEPVRERVIDGRKFINVATAIGGLPSPENPENMVTVMVNKAHVLGFEAGRTLSLLRLPDGLYVEFIGKPEADEELALPEGATLEAITLKQPWVVQLPTPTRTHWWFANGRGFQGPVELPDQG